MHFSALPFDILAEIASTLDPLDILNLSEVSKHLHDTFSDRLIWMNAVGRSTTSNQSFTPQLFIEDMSLRELQHTATSGHRTLRLLGAGQRDGVERFLEPTMIRTITPTTSGKGSSFHDMYIIPGGLFLITMNRLKLEIWNIGASTSHTPTVICSAEPFFGASFYGIESVAPMSRWRFRVATVLQSRDSDEDINLHHMIVYECDMSATPPTFTRLCIPFGAVVEGNSIVSTALRGDLLAFVSFQQVTVWNFVTNTYVACAFQLLHTVQVAFQGAYLIVNNPRAIRLWHLPKVLREQVPLPESRSQSNVRVTGAPRPDLQMVFDIRNPKLTVHLDNWFTNFQPHYFFDVLEMPCESKPYHIHVIQSDFDFTSADTSSSDQPLSRTTNTTPLRVSSMTSHPPPFCSHRICNKLLVASYMSRLPTNRDAAVLVAFVAEPAPPHPRLTEDPSNPLCVGDKKAVVFPQTVNVSVLGSYMTEHCFDPVSGRFVYFSQFDGFAILDLLESPRVPNE